MKIYNNEVFDGGENAVGIFLHRSSNDAEVYGESANKQQHLFDTRRPCATFGATHFALLYLPELTRLPVHFAYHRERNTAG